jgi:ATP:cob(I)alamin adenosyltransferase
MPRITKVYTRTGDDGTTGLGGGQRVPKDSARIEAFGTVDELSSAIGVAVALGLQPRLAETLARIQNELFNLGSDLCILEEDKVAMPVPVVEERNVDALERLMDELSEELAPLENFILPGGSPGAAQLRLPPGRAAGHRAGPPGAGGPLRRPLPQPPLGRLVRHVPLREPQTGDPGRSVGQPHLTANLRA